MKMRDLSSTLSCTSKCIRFLRIMINKKIILGLFILSLCTACTNPSAMIGPAYTLTSTGNVVQAGFSYGSNELIKSYTGKTPIENLSEISSFNVSDKTNIKKSTLESEDFYNLVTNKVKKTRNILKLSNQ